MSISHFFRILWVRRTLILATTLAALAAALVVIAIVPPRYEASSRLMLDIVKPDPLTGEVMSSKFAGAYFATQKEIITDYRVAGRVVDAFGWTSSPELAAQYRQASGETGTMSFRRWLAQRIMDSTEVTMLQGSNILEITYTADNPETAAKVADALRDAYQEEMRAQRQTDARRNAEWFGNQTVKLRGQLAAAEQKLTAFERENGVVINQDGIDAESARLQAMSSMPDTPQAPVYSAPAAAIISPSQGQLAQLDANIQTVLATLGPNHPRVLALRQQRAALASTVSQELAAARAAAGGGSTARGPSMGQLFSQQQQKVLAQRGKADEARQLAVDVAVLRDQTQKSASRTAELQQEADSTETGLSYLGSAVPPRSAKFPNVPLVVLGGLFLGLFLGIAIAVLIELLRRRVRGPSDLVFGDIPLLGISQVDATPRGNRLGVSMLRGLLPAPRAAA